MKNEDFEELEEYEELIDQEQPEIGDDITLLSDEDEEETTGGASTGGTTIQSKTVTIRGVWGEVSAPSGSLVNASVSPNGKAGASYGGRIRFQKYNSSWFGKVTFSFKVKNNKGKYILYRYNVNFVR